MIRIITDSLSDITQQEAKTLHITVLPLYVIFDQDCYLDGVTISQETFYRRLNEEGTLPTTSQVTPESFLDAFGEAIVAGDEVLYIGGSSQLSGTYQSAVIARDMHPQRERIHVIDTLNATIGQKIAVMEAVRLRDQGVEIEHVRMAVQSLLPRIRMVGVVDDLHHLVRGGRLGMVGAQVGSVLHLKPTLRLKDGKLQQEGMKRGRKSVLAWFCEQLDEQPLDQSYPVHIAASDAPERIEVLSNALQAHGIAKTHLQESSVGAVIGTHTGSGCFAMAWVEKE